MKLYMIDIFVCVCGGEICARVRVCVYACVHLHIYNIIQWTGGSYVRNFIMCILHVIHLG